MDSPDFGLQGQVAVVTGAGRGIGRGVALLLARTGASVVVAGRDLAALQTLVAEIAEEGGVAWPQYLDVTDLESISSAMDAARQHFGTLDILVNNAGLGANHRAED
ncbi:MAG: SDR family oxidoreductase, partial [Acidimicrobiia bacterium]|nr:SDR family oxidoreductase [Acidimicrobiia bacterium]